jgi:transposase
MRYDLSDFEWSVIHPLLPNKLNRAGFAGGCLV